jgi:predicted DNA-binding mobile mystery protein A
MARRKLDKELRYYRMAGKEKKPTQGLLRKVRQVLGVPVADLAREMEVNRSVIFRLEEREKLGTISLLSMSRAARAMGCKVVYAVIPEKGETLEEMAELRKWRKRLGAG